MMDPAERESWFYDLYVAALKLDADEIEAFEWAHSMSLIAEQLVDEDGEEMADVG